MHFSIVRAQLVKFLVYLTHIIRYSEGVLDPFSHCSIFLETPLAGKAGWENDLSFNGFDQGILIGKYHCTVHLFDWFGLVCFANKNIVIQLIPSQSNRRSMVQ
jgi:hypothetical protein